MRETDEQQAGPKLATSSATKIQFGRLVEACKRKELASLREILEREPKLLSYHDKQHRNLLHYAAILVQEDDIQTGGKCQTSDESGAKLRLDEQTGQCVACFAYLLDKGRRLDQLERLWNEADLDGLTILHLAVISCNVPLVREILLSRAAAGASLPSLATRLDKEQHSPLHWAVITNSLASVKLLVEHSGAQLAQQADLNGATPLHYASQTCDYLKYRQQLRQMLKNAAGSPAASQSPSGADEAMAEVARDPSRGLGKQASAGSLADSAATSGPAECNLDILVYLTRLPGLNLECLDRDARTPLLWAASSGNRQAVQILVEAGANVLCRDSNGLGTLHCAASHGFLECVELLLQLSDGQQLEQADSLHCTPLFYAVLGGNIDCVELLLERGARADWQDVKGRTAGHFAALRGQLNTLKLLEARRANLWLPNKQGDLPLHYAIKSGRQQVVAWLLERSPYERAVNAINNAGRAPIHLAIGKQSAQMVDFLIRRGANLNQLVKVRDKTAPADKQAEANVLVNGAETRANHRYETALDMARRLAAARCLELLEAAGAESAAQVLAGRRQTTGGHIARSLFDLQAAEVASPIGFDTSASSAEPQSEPLTLSQPAGAAAVPQLPARPAPLASCRPADQSDSTASSALSQCSLTSLHGLPQSASKRAVPAASAGRRVSEAAPSGPVRGGIDYQNDFMRASIKCKLYNNHSFPPLETETERGHSHKRRRQQQQQQQQHPCHQEHLSAGSPQQAAHWAAAPSCTTPQHEIVARVNVFGSPTQHHCARPAERRERQRQLAAASQMAAAEYAGETPSSSTEADSEAANSEMNFAESDDEARLPPHLGLEQQQQQQRHQRLQQREPSRFLPPSQGYTQHLPVILSAEEERSTSGETVTGVQQAADGRPRDWVAARGAANTTGRRLGELCRHQVASPVAEYIHQQRSPTERRPVSTSHQQQEQAQRVHYSQVRAKVDSHRNDSGLSSHFGDDYDGHSAAGRHSKSWSSSSAGGQQTLPSGARPAHQAQAPVSPARAHRGRSPTHARPLADERAGEQRPRRTVIKTRRLSVDTNELALRVEKSIRKYKQETKLFEELQRLKRSQIRSGRANEALLVKRLIEQFKSEAHHDASLIGLETYNGPFTYKAYELYLYDQLRKLSQSNDAKLVGAHLAHTFTAGPAARPPRDLERDYLEEDLRAELELQRVINGTEQEAVPSYLGGEAERIAIEASGALEEIRLARESAQEEQASQQLSKQDSMGQSSAAEDKDYGDQMSSLNSITGQEQGDKLALENKDARGMRDGLELAGGSSQAISSASSSRRSSVDVEREKLERLPLRLGSAGSGPARQAVAVTDGHEEADAQERRPLEEQLGSLVDDGQRREIAAEAKELTAAIITDALGNVSRNGTRASSPVDAREPALESESRAPAERQVQAGEALKQETTDEDRCSSEEGARGDEPWEEPRAQPQAPPKRAITRRRSVVNIGNKMEVVDHYVGIAIEPVAEGNRHSEDEAESQAGDDREAQVAPTGLSEADSSQLSQAEVEQSADESGQGRDSEKQPIGDSQDKSGAESEAADAGRSSTPVSAAHTGERVLEESATVRQPETGYNDDERTRASTIPRAPAIGSEPLRADKSRPTAAIESLSSKSSSGARRASSPPAPECGGATGALGASSGGRHASISEKVFTGFDLDSMHSARLSRRDRQSSSQSLVRQQEQQQQQQQQQQQDSRPERTFTRHQHRRERSRLPSTPYVVEIPTGLVKERWCAIKRRERQRLRNQGAACRPADSIELSDGQGRPSSQGVSGLRGSQTQPNLQEKGARADPSDERSHFTLIYELNKHSLGPTTSLRLHSQQAKQTLEQRWCQTRVSRIVDVRTLKRTLSLPESLLYSNDLLKRFNILKL